MSGGWQIEAGGAHSAARSSETSQKMIPGIYTIGQTMMGLVYIPLKPNREKLILSGGMHKKIKTQVDAFWKNAAQYRKYGLSHKRGILFYGPPGTGKSCLMRILAKSVIRQGGVVFSIDGDPAIFGPGYNQFRAIEPKTPILVMLEDIDRIAATAGESRVTNMLDGVGDIENVIFVATTNHFDEITPRMKRPSRFDLLIEVDAPGKTVRKAYLRSINKEMENLEGWENKTEGMSFADLKELFLSVFALGCEFEETKTRLGFGCEGSSYKWNDATDEDDDFYEEEYDEKETVIWPNKK